MPKATAGSRRIGGATFCTTRWSIVLAAGGQPTARSRESLAKLCEQYWQPVYAYVRRRGVAPEDAQDLTQQFFTTFIEKHYVQTADPARGRFRSFLLASVQHFLLNDWDRQRAKKRGGGVPLLPLEFETAEGVLRREPVTRMTPEREFEQRWAIEVVHRVLDRLQQEQDSAGKSSTFRTLRPYLDADRGGESYADAAALLNASPGAVRVAVHRLRRRFRALLLDEIADTVNSAAEVQEEVHYLMKALQSPDHDPMEVRRE
jgi:RNA polymerase sigma factor (sigma-70 family)